MEAIEAARKQGARYFVTHYAFGMNERVDMIDTLADRYTTIKRTDKWVIIDLQSSQETNP